MGISYGLQFNICDFHKDIMLGIGMLYMPASLINKINGKKSLFEDLVKSPKIRQNTYKLLSEKNGQFADEYGHELYACESCNKIYNHFYYKIEYQDGQYEPDYKCSKCKHPLIRLRFKDNHGSQDIADLQGNPVTLKCPKCGSGILGINNYIMWD